VVSCVAGIVIGVLERHFLFVKYFTASLDCLLLLLRLRSAQCSWLSQSLSPESTSVVDAVCVVRFTSHMLRTFKVVVILCGIVSLKAFVFVPSQTRDLVR
jgi:hypothetical protein